MQDYHAAVDAARSLTGQVIGVAAERVDVSAVIVMTPLTSGLVASRASAGSTPRSASS